MYSNANSLNETDSLNQMRVFINFWKLEIKNSILHIFSFFFYKFSFENSFFLVYFGLPNKFFSLKNRNLFLKIENKEEKQLPNIL